MGEGGRALLPEVCGWERPEDNGGRCLASACSVCVACTAKQGKGG